MTMYVTAGETTVVGEFTGETLSRFEDNVIRSARTILQSAKQAIGNANCNNAKRCLAYMASIEAWLMVHRDQRDIYRLDADIRQLLAARITFQASAC